VLDHVGHRERLARTSYTHQHLMLFTLFKLLRKRLDRLRLVTAGLKWRSEFEHGLSINDSGESYILPPGVVD